MKRFMILALAVVFLTGIGLQSAEAAKPRAGSYKVTNTNKKTGNTTSGTVNWKTDGKGKVDKTYKGQGGGEGTQSTQWKRDGGGQVSNTRSQTWKTPAGGTGSSEGQNTIKVKSWDPKNKKGTADVSGTKNWAHTGAGGKEYSGTTDKAGEVSWQRKGQGQGGQVGFTGGKVVKGQGPWGGNFSITVAGTGSANYKWVKQDDGTYALDWDGDGYGTYTVEYMDKNGKAHSKSKNFSGKRGGQTRWEPAATGGSVDDGM